MHSRYRYKPLSAAITEMKKFNARYTLVLTMYCTHYTLYTIYCTHHVLHSPYTVHHVLYSPYTIYARRKFKAAIKTVHTITRMSKWASSARQRLEAKHAGTKEEAVLARGACSTVWNVGDRYS
jgi:hypothetical protein